MTHRNSAAALNDLEDYQIVPRMSSISISPNSSEKNLRLFRFTKTGQSWTTGSYTEIPASESEIRKLAKPPKKETKTVKYQWLKMSEPRREQLQSLLDHLEYDTRIKWDIKSIINDHPEHTKRKGEIAEFSVVVEVPGTSASNSISDNKSISTSTNRERRKSYHQERSRRRSSVAMRDVSPKERRPSRQFSQSPQRNGSRVERRPTEYDTNRSQIKTIAPDDDPFGAKELFNPDGIPNHAEGILPYNFAGLPPELSRSEPIGKLPPVLKDPRMQKDKDGKDKRSKSRGRKNSKGGGDEPLDIDAIINGAVGGIEVLPNPLDDDDHGLIQLGEAGVGDLPVEVEHPKNRRRKSGAGEDFLAHRSRRRSHSRPAIHHRRKSSFGQGYLPRTSGGILASGKHANSSVSTATPSIYSNDSILEGELEEISSSDSSNQYEVWDDMHRRERAPHDGYMYPNGRYRPASRQHRRGPPSPQRGFESNPNVDKRRYSRHQERGDDGHALVTTIPGRRPSMHGRYSSMDQTIHASQDRHPQQQQQQRGYDDRERRYSYSSTRRERPAILQTSIPRQYSQHHEPAMRSPNADMYPHDLERENYHAEAAELYMRGKDREQELMDRAYEQELMDRAYLERRERVLDEMERSLVNGPGSLMRRDSVGYHGNNNDYRYSNINTGGGLERRRSTKYTHEPRASRRYSEAPPVQIDNGRYRD